jgi:hypothetical protein
MLDAEHATRTIPRSVISYRQLLTDWRSVADRIANDLRLTWPSTPDDAAIAQFIQPDLCHHAAGPGELRARPPLDRWVTQVRDALDQLQRRVPAPIDGASLCSTTCAGNSTPQASSSAAPTRQSEPTSAYASNRWTRIGRACATTERPARSRAEDAERRADGLDADLARTQQHTVSLQHRLEGLVQTERQMSSELASARHRVDALLSSGSWRVTAPSER